MATQLGKHDILVADPPLVEAHGKTHELEGEVSREWDDGDVEDLLFEIGVECQERVGVLGQVMRAVVFPKTADLVHESMVPVEPKVKHDAVQANFEWEPNPADG